jgi:hypothetical protein
VARSEWQTFRKTDAKVILSFERIAANLELQPSAHVQIRIAQALQQVVGFSLADVGTHPFVSELVKSDQALAGSY